MRTPATIEPAEWIPGERISIETASALVGAVRRKAAKLCGAKPAELGKLVVEIDMAMMRVKTFLDDVKRGDRAALPPHPADSEPLYPITTEEALEIEEIIEGEFLDYLTQRDAEMVEEDYYELH